MRHNSAIPGVFVEVLKVMNYSWLWDAKIAWHSPRTTRRIGFYSLVHGLRVIHGFKLTWHYLIVEILANSSEISSTIWLLYGDQLRYHVSRKKCFGYFRGVMAQFEPINH